MKKFLLISGSPLLLMLALPLIALNNEALTRWILPELLRIVPGKLDATHVSGDLTGPITLREIRWQQGGISIAATELSIDWQPFALLAGDVAIDSLDVQQLSIAIKRDAAAETGESRPWPEYLVLPVAITIESGTFTNGLIEIGSLQETFERIELAAFAFGGTSAGWQHL